MPVESNQLVLMGELDTKRSLKRTADGSPDALGKLLGGGFDVHLARGIVFDANDALLRILLDGRPLDIPDEL
jgi:hypothetical protein